MHTFQPFSLEMLDLNPFTRIGRDTAILASGNKEKSNLMTIAWGGLGPIFGKNAAYIFVRESRFTKHFIDEDRFFSISFMKEGYKSALDYCGTVSGKDEDKWAGSGLTEAFRHGIPYPDEAELVLLCEVLTSTPINEEHFKSKKLLSKWYKDKDFHTMYIGEIVEAMAR